LEHNRHFAFHYGKEHRMTAQQIRTHVQHQPPQNLGGDPAGGGTNGLQQQAAAYGNIARKALESCKKGLSADEALQRRRNRSGQ
jgi:hypothetical protein